MGLRPGKCYRTMKRAYTRIATRVQKKAFVKGVPAPRIREFEMGNKKAPFDWKIDMIAKRDMQLRSNALEAARMAGNKTLENNIGIANYHYHITKYPHHVLRENCMATGAGADRFSTGMAKSFGKIVGVAARVKEGEIIAYVRLNNQFIDVGKRALQKTALKLGMPAEITKSQMRELTRELIKVKIIKEKKEKPAEGAEGAEGAAAPEAGKESEAGKKEAGGKDAKPAAGKESKPAAGKESGKPAGKDAGKHAAGGKEKK